MPWVRSGECCKCGDCCRGRDPFDGDLGVPPIAGYCALYRVVDGAGHCAGHGVNDYYLRGCNVWPDRPEVIADYPNCSYRFAWAD